MSSCTVDSNSHRGSCWDINRAGCHPMTVCEGHLLGRLDMLAEQSMLEGERLSLILRQSE